MFEDSKCLDRDPEELAQALAFEPDQEALVDLVREIGDRVTWTCVTA